MQALTYDVRKQRDEDRKEFMQGGAAAIIQVGDSSYSFQLGHDHPKSTHLPSLHHSETKDSD